MIRALVVVTAVAAAFCLSTLSALAGEKDRLRSPAPTGIVHSSPLPWAGPVRHAEPGETDSDIPQDLQEDLGALDEAMAEEKTVSSQEESGVLQKAMENLDLSLRLRGTRFFHGPRLPDLPLVSQDQSRYLGDVRLTARTWAGDDFWRASFEGWLQTGSQEDTYRGVTRWMSDHDHYRPYLELNQAYLTFSPADFDIIIGRKTLNNGLAAIYSPANRYTALDLNDPLDPAPLGSWMVQGDYYLDDLTFTGAVMPWFQPSRTPAASSRWIGLDASPIVPTAFQADTPDYRLLLRLLYFFRNLSGIDLLPYFRSLLGPGTPAAPGYRVEQNWADPSDPGDWNYFSRIKGSTGSWDWFASWYGGQAFWPVVRVELEGNTIVITQEFPFVDNFSAGASTTVGDFTFHLEGLYNITRGGRDDDYINWMTGVLWANPEVATALHLHRLSLAVEYANEIMVHEQDRFGYFVSSETARLGRNDLFANLSLDITDKWNISLFTNLMIDENDLFSRISTAFQYTENLRLEAALEIFDGDDVTYYGYWDENDRAVLTMTYSY
jgi:hypothetical protein